jgi:N-acetylglucosaminyldiphosphoundecaprenol N-acetyl-beta-D-mannosaminyltransferase
MPRRWFAKVGPARGTPRRKPATAAHGSILSIEESLAPASPALRGQGDGRRGRVGRGPSDGRRRHRRVGVFRPEPAWRINENGRVEFFTRFSHSRTRASQPLNNLPVGFSSMVAIDNSFRVLGVRVDRVDMDETLRRIERFVEEGGPHRIVTINLDTLRHGHSCPSFRKALDAADLALADGVPVLWVSRLFGRPLKERVAGVDLAERCAQLAAANGYRVFFLGAGPGVAQSAARVLRERYPGLEVAGAYSPPMGEFSEEEELRIFEAIAAAKPDILLVALPTPRLELWNYANIRRLNVPVVFGVGAAFDMLSGAVPRAPRWMQRTGFEWLFRLFVEPRKLWKRYLVHDTTFVLRILISRVTSKRASRRAP